MVYGELRFIEGVMIIVDTAVCQCPTCSETLLAPLFAYLLTGESHHLLEMPAGPEGLSVSEKGVVASNPRQDCAAMGVRSVQQCGRYISETQPLLIDNWGSGPYFHVEMPPTVPHT
jgi:hypothetical protein